MGLAIVPMLLLGMVCGSIILAWLYRASGGSILIVVLWHATYNLVSGTAAAHGLVAAVVTSAVIVWAVANSRRRGSQMEAGQAQDHRVGPGRLRLLRPMAGSPRLLTSTSKGRLGDHWLQVSLGSDARWSSSSASQGQRSSDLAFRTFPARAHLTAARGSLELGPSRLIRRVKCRCCST